MLAGLVLTVALTVDPRRVWLVRAATARIAAVVALPLLTLLPAAVGLASLFSDPIRDGLVALGLAPTEVAAAGLVGLAAGAVDEALLAVIASFLVVAALAPVGVPALSGSTLDAVDLAVRFGSVLILPLAAGLAIRGSTNGPRLGSVAERAVAPVLALLVYAALADLPHPASLGPVAAAAALFLGVALGATALLWRWFPDRRTYPFVFGMRDFAVGVGIASAMGSSGAGAVPAVYGIMMLIASTVAAAALRRTSARRHDARKDP